MIEVGMGVVKRVVRLLVEVNVKELKIVKLDIMEDMFVGKNVVD